LVGEEVKDEICKACLAGEPCGFWNYVGLVWFQLPTYNSE